MYTEPFDQDVFLPRSPVLYPEGDTPEAVEELRVKNLVLYLGEQ